MKQTVVNLTKLRIAGMLSEAAVREAEKKILEIPDSETTDTEASVIFGY